MGAEDVDGHRETARALLAALGLCLPGILGHLASRRIWARLPLLVPATVGTSNTSAVDVRAGARTRSVQFALRFVSTRRRS